MTAVAVYVEVKQEPKLVRGKRGGSKYEEQEPFITTTMTTKRSPVLTRLVREYTLLWCQMRGNHVPPISSIPLVPLRCSPFEYLVGQI
jgi:hypothetical protein